jgi:NRPS condensation-like uncharacterized protein
MKYIITESQLNSKVYDKFIDMLVDKTEILNCQYREYRGFDYVANIKYPHTDDPYILAFVDTEEYEFTSPSRYSLKDWFQYIGVDIDESPYLCKTIYEDYLDKLREKIVDYINEYVNRKWE